MSSLTDRLRHGLWYATSDFLLACEAADRIDELEAQAETARQGFELIAALLWANRRPPKLSIELETLNAYHEAAAKGMVN